jgi:hypothetical protein
MEKALAAAKVTVDDLKKGFEYYFKPGRDGNTQATKYILNSISIRGNFRRQNCKRR